MRKDNFARKSLKKFFYSTFEIRGLNLDRLINTLGKRGITLLNVKKYGNKRLIITVNSAENEKIFAIGKELCYNIKKVRDGGRLYPALFLLRNAGLLIGAAIFLISIFIINDLIFSFSFTGSGALYGREITEYLNGKGVAVFSRFSGLDLKTLGESILADNPHLSFVDIRRSGNRLEINAAAATDNVKRLEGDAKELTADAAGTVETVKVYRGTAEVQAGQTVEPGDVLVAGYAVVKDRRLEINVIAFVTVISEYRYEFRCDSDAGEDIALIFAEEAFGDKEITSFRVDKTEEEKGFLYTVYLTYRIVYFVG